MSPYAKLGRTVNIVLWSEMAVGLVFVMLRLYTRKFIIHSLGWDDYVIVLTWVRSYCSLKQLF